MKVLHLVDGSTSVGAITSVKKLCNNLKGKNIDVMILSYNSMMKDNNFDTSITVKYCNLKFNQILHKFSIGKINILTAVFILIYHFIRDISKLNSFCKEEDIDIIHTHYLNDNFLASFLNRRVKKVAHIRSIVNKSFFFGIGFKLYKHYIFKNSSLIIGISKTVLKIFHFPETKKVQVLYNGISLTGKSNASENILAKLSPENQKKKLVGTVTRYQKSKGLEFLLEIVKASTSCNDLHFVVIAPENTQSEKEFKSKLVEDVKKSHIENLITFAGPFPNASYFMPYFSILVHPTLEREGFGNVVLEAFGEGVPVISTDCGGPSEIIEQGKSGYIISEKSPQQFVGKIELLHENFRKFSKMQGEALKRAALPKFSIEYNVNKLISFYHNLC